MAFDLIIFATALYALTSETVEDSFMLIIFQVSFGKKSVLYGLVAASIAIASIMVILVIYGIPNLESYSDYVAAVSGLFLISLGVYWIIKFFLARKRAIKKESEFEQKTVTKSVASFTMVSVELLEILALLVPFILTGYVIETSIAMIVSILISIALMITIGRKLRSKLENKLTQVKLFAGFALILSGSIIGFDLL
ncbi:MAG: hypothetical protein GWN01_08980 [Nitrosopumilaceae archaeon]|nr:hypothetical protein [Nitrosopumilaceae archaeon]NIU01042.1 hypothetical protein [Nitrosopumilaceae archaeon]NIU87476.1 hypothetical protein [Nitrosopumilaceae archaeon]NIV65526.1 hypothetical protein [Nitrosopumilaceae archaeon]NIX61644.1 hypothetical protein [Nitrosopumilaceae archaeon]